MLLYLQNDYAKARAPRNGAPGSALSHERRSEPPPRPVRASLARGLVAVAGRVDRESARRALAS